MVSLWTVGMKEKINKFLCRRFGHVTDSVDVAIYMIEVNAINAPRLNPELKCQRCKKLLANERGHCLIAGWGEGMG